MKFSFWLRLCKTSPTLLRSLVRLRHGQPQKLPNFQVGCGFYACWEYKRLSLLFLAFPESKSTASPACPSHGAFKASQPVVPPTKFCTFVIDSGACLSSCTHEVLIVSLHTGSLGVDTWRFRWRGWPEERPTEPRRGAARG